MSRQRRPFSERVMNAVLVIVLLPFVLPLALISVVLFLLYTITLYLLVWSLWLPRGKDILLVHSDSPIWHEYMRSQVLPLVQERAVVLNWSERKKWRKWSLEVAAFHRFAGAREFNPIVVVFRPFRLAKVFRFWSAFKDFKQGYREPVDMVREELSSIL